MLQRRTLASGFAFHFEWSELAGAVRCLRNWGDGGVYDTRFDWLPGGISRATDSRGGVTEYQHNAQSQLLRKRSPEGRETRYRYDDHNLLRSRTDGAGQATRFEHDAEGRLVAVIDPLDQAWRLQYDADGNPVLLTDPLNKRWTRRFDAQHRLVLCEPTGATTRHSYNAQGLLATVTDAAGRRRSLLWDAQARLVGETGFDGVRRRYQVDADERVTAVITHGSVTVRYEHDAIGRLLAALAPDGRSTRVRYDAVGRVTHFTDGAGNTTEYRYDDGQSQPSARIDPLGQAMNYAYDSERNLVALVNAKGERHTLAYDRDELLVEETGFVGRVQRYQYDPAGQLVRHLQIGASAASTDSAEPSWHSTAFERDPLGRLLTKHLHDGASARYAYDAAGRLLSAATADSQVSFLRDALGRVLREVQDGQVVSSTYDLLGRRVRLLTPDGQCQDSRFDAQGRLATLTLDGQPLTHHGYDELGRAVSRRQGSLDSRFSHDPMGRLETHRAHRALRDGAEQVLGRRFAHDAAGRVSAIDDFRGGASRYTYNPADRLLRVQGLAAEDFVHDPAGNLLGSPADGGRVEGNRLLMLGLAGINYLGNTLESGQPGQGRGLMRALAIDGRQKNLHLGPQHLPGGISRYRQVRARRQRHEAGAWNQGGHDETALEGHHGVVLGMQDQRRAG